MILIVISVIFEKNMLELTDSEGKRYYYKGKHDEKLEAKFKHGDQIVFTQEAVCK